MITEATYEILVQIANQAEKVREAQKAYFKSKGYDLLRASQTAERELDQLIQQYRSGSYANQSDLFHETVD